MKALSDKDKHSRRNHYAGHQPL